MGKLKYKALKFMQPGSKTNPVGEETILDQSTRSFTVLIDLYSPTFISQEQVLKRKGRLINFLPGKGGGASLLEKGGLIEDLRQFCP